MATAIVDDLDPTVVAQETIRFSLNGKHYTIDLTSAHAEQMRGDFGKYIAAAREVDADTPDGDTAAHPGSQASPISQAVPAGGRTPAPAAAGKNAAQRGAPVKPSAKPSAKSVKGSQRGTSANASRSGGARLGAGSVEITPALRKQIREYAANKGIELNSRGQIPKKVVAQFLQDTRRKRGTKAAAPADTAAPAQLAAVPVPVAVAV